MEHYVVVGAGQAGCSLVAKLRALGFEGRITLIGSEPYPPYQRPPLSKGYLLGEIERDRLFLRPKSYYDEQKIELILGKEALSIDLDNKLVHLEGGQDVPYDKLAITTGMIPRKLPEEVGGALAGVHVVRSLSDVDGMAGDMHAGGQLLVVGGGYIGLEAAAVARKLGLDVTLIEIAPRILARVAAEETADYFRDLHSAQGVDIREGVGLERLLGEDRVTGAVLTDGTEVACDMVIAGIGLLPRCKIADAAGLEVSNGVKTDEHGQTSDPNVWAAGDCASFPFRGERIRLESVPNAIEHAELVAENMMGGHKAYEPHPWFWSDQYDVKLQIAGLHSGYDRVYVRPGDKDGVASHWYFCGADLVAVDAMNDPRAYMVGKRLLEAGKSPPPEAVTDPGANLKALLTA
ncbi:MAG: FAD/NAD(P)-binding oxidoreductase [Pseudomonadota bacterium]